MNKNNEEIKELYQKSNIVDKKVRLDASILTSQIFTLIEKIFLKI